jgi:glycosyltransferase involved in cell wall biosynthesis
VLSSLVWVGPLRDPTGYADEGRGFLRALHAAGHAPAARPLDGTSRVPLTASDQRIVEDATARLVEPPGIVVHHYQPSEGQLDSPSMVNVARTMFETDALPAGWLDGLRMRDEVWVPCRHNAESFMAGGVSEDRIRVVGETLDFDLFRPGAEPYDLGVPEGRRVFLTMFDFQERKGWRQLLEAWGHAFTPSDDVCLVLKTGSWARGQSAAIDRIHGFLRDRFGGVDRVAPIRIVTDLVPAADMPRLYAAADAYVLPTRGEGWGRTQMEALACGVPTVTSRWSGVLEFMDDETSWLVDGRVVPVPEDDEVFGCHRGHRWFECDVDALAGALRAIAADPMAARARAALARPRLLERWGPERIVRDLEEAAAAALAGHGERRARPVSCVVTRAVEATTGAPIVDQLRARGENALLHLEGGAVRAVRAPFISLSVPDASAEPPTRGAFVAVLPRAVGRPPLEWLLRAARVADRVWIGNPATFGMLAAAGVPPGIVEVLPDAPEDLTGWLQDRVAELADDPEPLLRDIVPAELERRERAVLYCPDWTAEERWAPALEAWAATVAAHDPVTLVLAAPHGAAAQTAAAVEHALAHQGSGLDRLPDVCLVETGDGVAPLVAATDAVLLDGEDAPRPAAYRRARAAMLAEPASIAAWLAG